MANKGDPCLNEEKEIIIQKIQKLKLKLKFVNTDDVYEQYKLYRDTINTLKRKSNRLYCRDYFTRNVNNSKKTWKGIIQLLNRNKLKQKAIFLNDNGLTTNRRKVANIFNRYY